MSQGRDTAAPKNIVLATDLTLTGDRAYDRAVQIATESKATLTVLHVVETGPDAFADVSRRKSDAQAEMARLIERHTSTGGLAIEPRITLGDPVDRIVAVCRETDSDLLVTGLGHAKSLGEKLLGSTVAKVLQELSCPVLSVRGRVAGGYSTIGIGVDFSEASRKALHIAIRLFPRRKFWLVHAHEKSFGSAFQSDFQRSANKLGLEHAIDLFLNETTEQLAAQGLESPHGAQAFSWDGSPVAVFKTFLDIHRPDLVVVGTHGRSGLQRLTLGSVAEQLLNALPCDVLAVPTRAETTA